MINGEKIKEFNDEMNEKSATKEFYHNNCACELLLPPSKETMVRLAKIREEPLPKKYEDHIRAVSERFMRDKKSSMTN